MNQIVELGTGGAAGNLVICEVLLMHIKEEVLDDTGRIDPVKLDAVARMGGDYYLRVQKDNIITVPKPNDKLGIGLDQIPIAIRHSKVQTGNDLGRLGNAERLPDENEILELRKSPSFRQIMGQGELAVHTLARKYLHEGKVHDAWVLLLANHTN